MRLAWLLPLLAALVGVSALYETTDGLRAFTTEGARRLAVAEQRPAVPDLHLESMTGESLPLRPTAGESVLVEFVFTSCPVICQVAAQDFASLRDRLAEDGQAVRMLSVSFDPQSDDLEAMQAYGAAHGADGRIWTVARPDPQDLEMLLERFGVTVIPDPWFGYQHNAAIHLIDAQGRLVEIFDTDAVEAVAQAVARRP